MVARLRWAGAHNYMLKIIWLCFYGHSLDVPVHCERIWEWDMLYTFICSRLSGNVLRPIDLRPRKLI